MTWVDEWPELWPERWGSESGIPEWGSGGNYSVGYSRAYDLERAAAHPQAARERDLWELFVRDADRRVAAVVHDYQKAVLVPRTTMHGAWVIDLPRATDAAEELLKPQAGIIALRNGVVVLSGPVRERTRSYADGHSTLTVSGPDDFVFLQDHIAMPQPANADPPFELNTYDTRTGSASALMAAYIDANLGPSATPRRQVLGLTAPDTGVGSSLTQKARYQTVGHIMSVLARRSVPRLAVRVRQVKNTTTIRVEINVPIDRSVVPNKVVFSVDLGNVESFDYTETAGANWIVVGGEGNGKDRYIGLGGDPVQIQKWGAIEKFVAHADVNTDEERDEAVRGDLIELGEQTSFNCELTESATFRFMEDFDVGDYVCVEVDGVELVESIHEAEITLDRELARVKPRVASPGARKNPNESRLPDAVREVRGRVADVERFV